MSVNVELLQKTLAQIEAHPETWNQRDWRTETKCGTAYCFAGWATVLSGAAFVRQEDGSLSWEYVMPPGGGDSAWIQDYAAELLGIGSRMACELFDGDNTLADLRHMVAELVTAGGA